jgi:hypothetical protein
VRSAVQKKTTFLLDASMVQEIHGDPAHNDVFYEANPTCPSDQRYKIVINGKGGTGMFGEALYVLGRGRTPFPELSRTHVPTDGAFDLAELDLLGSSRENVPHLLRNFRNGIRDILTAASPDILKFPRRKEGGAPTGKDLRALHQPDAAVLPRTAHHYRFPMRYYDRGKPAWEWPAMSALPDC